MNMDPTPAPTDAPHPAKEFGERLDSILAQLLPVIAAGLHRLVRFCVPVWNRVSRTRLRFVRLLAHIAAGRLPRQRAPRPDGQPAPKGGPPAPYIPRRRAWLVVHAGHNAAAAMWQIETLLLRHALGWFAPFIVRGAAGWIRDHSRLGYQCWRV